MTSRGSGGSVSKRWVVRAALGAAVVLAAVLAATFWPSRTPQADLRRVSGQNVLLITIDTLRADALSAYGGPAATPALDRLAADGVRFDFAHAHAVLTLASHASILTGVLPFQHGIRDNSGYRLPANARTAATLFKQAGYATGAFVAAFPLHGRFGLNAGFETYDDRFADGHGLTDFNMPERPASAVVPLAQAWIAGRAGVPAASAPRPPAARPWFAWVHVFDPHAPYRPPAPFDSQYSGRPYYGEVAATDAALAPLLDGLRSAATPTLVIVTGDHGEGLGEHGEEAHGVFVYESTLRIPLIIAQLGGHAPGASPTARAGGVPAGEVSSIAARHIDILPTMLDAIGQPVPADLPGRTLLPREERRVGAPPRATYFEAMSGMLNHGWAPLSGVLAGREKWIDLPIAERYDLEADPAERANLAGRLPEQDRRLTAALEAFKPARPGERLLEDPEAAARLRALGYVSGSAATKTSYGEDDDPKRLIDIDSAIHRAVDAVADGRPDDAADIYRRVIERRPGMAIAHRHLAFLEWQRGNVAAAIDVLRRAIAHGVSDRRAVSQLGEYLTDAGQIAEGLRMLEPLAQRADAEADTLNALAIAYARAGRVDDARQVFERLIAVMPGSSVPLENLGVLALEHGDLRGAKAYFTRAIAVSPGSSRAHAGAGATAFRAGDRPSAYESWARAIQLDPGNYEAMYSLGVNLAQDGRPDAARHYLDQFMRTAPPALTAQRQDVARLLQSLR